MLEWIAEKIAVAAIFPWRLPIVGLTLTIFGAVVPFFVSDLPWSYIALFYSSMLGIWAYAEAKANTVIGPFIGLITLVGCLGLSAAQGTWKQIVDGKGTIDRATGAFGREPSNTKSP